MRKSERHKFQTKMWVYQGSGAWYFVTLPRELSDRIRAMTAGSRSAWGSVRVEAAIGRTKWNTSLFPDKKAGAYLLPVKAEVRRKEAIGEGSTVTVVLELRA